jgi:hypothetical protein
MYTLRFCLLYNIGNICMYAPVAYPGGLGGYNPPPPKMYIVYWL